MAFSIEARVPFLDHELVEFIFSLPIDQKIKGGWNRAVYRNAMKGRMPEKNRLRRSKIGFTNPDITWMKEKAREIRVDLLARPSSRRATSTTRAQLVTAWDEYLAGRPGDGLHLLARARHRAVDAPLHRPGGRGMDDTCRRSTYACRRRRLRAHPGADAPHPHQGTARAGVRRVREARAATGRLARGVGEVRDDLAGPRDPPLRRAPGVARQAARQGRDQAPRRRRLLRPAQDAGRDHAGRLVAHVVRDDRRRRSRGSCCAGAATSTASPVTASPRSTGSAPRR